ncbi:MAG: TIGR04283 family arsenosugar biosynthesis glycosyltransferase [Pseudomonadota bacterium]
MRLSIIIPTLDEEVVIGRTLETALAQPGVHEIIVVDGGSSDRTTEIVSRFGVVRLLRSPAGRAQQMNAGARAATGDVLLFLHADTELPPDAAPLVESALQQPDVVAGSFYLAFDRRSPMLAAYSWFSRLNLPLFTYGDQALFFRAAAFKAIVGFAAQPLLEDFEIQRRIRRVGRFRKLGAPVRTSARRFEAAGVIRQQLVNIALVCAYVAGASPVWLKRFYR